MKTCPKCKTEYPDDKKFCKNCRVQLLSAQGPEPEFSASRPPQEIVPKTEEKTFNSSEPVVQKKRSFKIYLIAGAVLVVVVGIIIISSGSGNTVPPPQNTSNSVSYSGNSNETKPKLYSNSSDNINSSSTSVKDCLLEWHNSLGRFDYNNHIKYYAQTVKYFNKLVDFNYIIKEKNLFFNSGAWQKVSNDISEIRTESLNENKEITYFNYDCEFIKNTGRVFSVNVDKMIVWDKIDGYWKITEEKDVKLNNNRSHK